MYTRRTMLKAGLGDGDGGRRRGGAAGCGEPGVANAALRAPNSVPFPNLPVGKPTGAFPFQHLVLVMPGEPLVRQLLRHAAASAASRQPMASRSTRTACRRTPTRWVRSTWSSSTNLTPTAPRTPAARAGTTRTCRSTAARWTISRAPAPDRWATTTSSTYRSTTRWRRRSRWRTGGSVRRRARPPRTAGYYMAGTFVGHHLDGPEQHQHGLPGQRHHLGPADQIQHQLAQLLQRTHPPARSSCRPSPSTPRTCGSSSSSTSTASSARCPRSAWSTPTRARSPKTSPG